MDVVVDVFEALGDGARRELLTRLSAGPQRVVDLAAALPDISRPAVSKHLRRSLEAGLVDVEAVGRERHYSLNHATLARAHQWLGELLAGSSAEAEAEAETSSDPARPTPKVPASALEALDLEVRRASRERSAPTESATRQEAVT